MTNPSFDVGTFFFGLLAVTGLWHLLFVLYADYAIARFRQNIFAVRDEMFAEAANGNLDFNSPAYQMLRRTMNGFIRFGHDLGFGQYVAASWSAAQELRVPDPDPHSYSRRFDAALSTLSEDELALIEKFRMEMHQAVMMRVIVGSPPVLITLVPAALLFMAGDRVQKKIRFGINEIDEIAADFGRGPNSDGTQNLPGFGSGAAAA